MGVFHDEETGIFYLWNNPEIEYLEHGYMRREVLATKEEAEEIALRAVYDENVAHIAVTRTLSVGTSIVWLKVEREDMRKLQKQFLRAVDTDVSGIGDIIRALVPIADDHESAQMYAARRGIPYSQFIDEYQPETQLGNSITIKSGHRNVHVNLAGLHGVSLNINFISGDSYFGAISGGNVGGRNNVNTCVYFIVTRET
ncbi:hypothetical protein PLEOSDRAFT_177382 [Pleurotus ostreatus PC15]|uniref:Uncharacterized protein n=1 Tax=Pleurotus ostreatus (strain PC15) TaxID=1137138 RepID=A0A067N558_PLEO1|nr:hypothetical protein PLEOSDRAFT_177382 [Pleurotus ostreatus PC15]